MLIAFLVDSAVALKRIASLGELGPAGSGADFLCRVTKSCFITHNDFVSCPGWTKANASRAGLQQDPRARPSRPRFRK